MRRRLDERALVDDVLDEPEVPREVSLLDEAQRIKLQAVRDWILGQTQEAKVDPKALFEFVVREEVTQRMCRCMPHQRVFFDFVMAHRRCCIFMPAGTSKTFCTAAITLHLLGRDHTQRGAIISATQQQAMKPLGMVRDYIETSPELRLVYPDLRPSSNRHDPWGQTKITVERPQGIRDPSLVAIGMDGAILGSRLSWAVVDDVLDEQNTATEESCKAVYDKFTTIVQSRMDMHTDPERRGRVVVTNTTWSEQDMAHRLKNQGWPTLVMDIEGNVYLHNTSWDTDDIRPSRLQPMTPEGPYRLVANDRLADGGLDVTERVPLWPDKFSAEAIEELRRDMLSHRFNQMYRQRTYDESTARCKVEWLEKSKVKGRGLSLVSHYKGPNLTTTGVDLAVQEGKDHDEVAFVTVEFLPSGERRLLDIEIGQFDAPTIIEMCEDRAERYNSILRVENNAAQDYLLQIMRARNKSIRLRAQTTGRNKAHPQFGVEGILVEFRNGAWIIPCDSKLQCHPHVQKLLDQILYYSPRQHTGDALMAMWFAVEQGREIGAFSRMGQGGGLLSITAR